MDLVNWYQYSVSDAEGVFERRLTLLTKLQKCIAGLPQRNSLLLAGDFNCPVMAYPPVSGSCVLNALSTRYQDAKDLQNVLRTLHLCVLNAWQRPRHGQLATFTFGDIASQILCHREAAAGKSLWISQWEPGEKEQTIIRWKRRYICQGG